MSTGGLPAAITLVAAVLLSLVRSLWRVDEPTGPRAFVGGRYSPLLTWIKYRQKPNLRWQSAAWEQARARWMPLAELSAILMMAVWVGQFFLITSANEWPVGQDFALNVQGYFAWALLPKCGLCVPWSGQIKGGIPTFAELVSAAAAV